MNKIYRVYVEKKEGFNVEAANLYADIKAQLGIKELKGVRTVSRYDVCGIDEDTFRTACKTIFAELNADNVFFEMPDCKNYIIRELQTGTYDQRADSAEQCIKMLAANSSPVVKTASIFIFDGNLSSDDTDNLRRYLINPVETREGSTDMPDTLSSSAEIPADVEILSDFNTYSEDELATFIKARGLAMTLADARFIQEHYKKLDRCPTITEIKVIDTYWSDHCRHTTFMTRLDSVSFENDETGELEKTWHEYLQAREFVYGDKKKPITLMDLGTIAAKFLKKQGKMQDLDESEEINACSIRCDVDVDGEAVPYLIMFKNETHNHPTEIEPFGGAATCLGGAIRDPLSGRAYVYQAMRVTGCGDPLTPFEETIEGKLPQSVITKGAAAGYSSYGNQIGLATGHVSEIYHKGYAAKRMEIGAVIAAAPAKNVVRTSPLPGDVVLLVGGRTGRDGCGGATGSSKSHDISSLSSCGAEVQKGNPITERKIQRLFRNEKASRLIKRCNDFGAGGVSVAVGELSDGLLINLDLVPKKYDGLDGTELAISESQERMAVVVSEKDAGIFTALAHEENLECTQIAVITDDARMRMTWRGKTIVDIERAFLDTNGVIAHMNAVSGAKKITYKTDKVDDVKARWLESLSSLNGCSQRGLAERFDSTVGANTVLMPFGGKYQATPAQAMAAKIPTDGKTNTGTVMAYGFDPYLSEKSPYHGAMYAVMESLGRIAAAGADAKKAKLTFQEYFEKLGKDETRWGKPLSALLGAFRAQCAMQVAAIGGKDSMSGTFMDISVPPTLVSFAVAPADMRHIISPELKKSGHMLCMLRTSYDVNGIPDFKGYSALLEALHNAIRDGAVVSAATVSPEGIAATVSKMAFGNMLGVDFSLNSDSLFTPMPCSIIVELENAAAKNTYFHDLNTVDIGIVTDKREFNACGITISVQEAYHAFTATLEPVFTTGNHDTTAPCTISYTEKISHNSSIKIARPKVIVPVFPGTNCEYESIRAFENAGAKVESIVIKNTKPGDTEESLRELEKLIRSAQIIMLPGGFSSGDEPDGSAKFTATVFRSARVRDAVHDLLKNRDGLMLGICNGFQTLIKLGLVPYGEIRDTTETAPTLTFNRIGRHQSRIVRTRISSALSPWFNRVDAGDIISVPISHGEGRVVFPCETELELVKTNGQIACQYVDLEGKPSMDTDYNPAQSQLAIEALTSPDGRILGKMGHSERYTQGLYKNVKGNYDSGIFISGVSYFG